MPSGVAGPAGDLVVARLSCRIGRIGVRKDTGEICENYCIRFQIWGRNP